MVTSDLRGACEAYPETFPVDVETLLDVLDLADQRCRFCGQFDGTIYEGQVPGWTRGSNWEWVPCAKGPHAWLPRVDWRALVVEMLSIDDEYGSRLHDTPVEFRAYEDAILAWADKVRPLVERTEL